MRHEKVHFLQKNYLDCEFITGIKIVRQINFIEMTTYSSIPTSKRIELLDILRGFALFGILLVNGNDYRFAVPPSDPKFNELNLWFNNIIIAIADGSFYPLFSLLFGIGFAIWMDKSMKQNGGVLRFAWRSFILFLLACFFYSFIEDRDILIRYSILSMPLLLFYKARPKTLLISAFVFLLIALFFTPIRKEINNLRGPQALVQQQKDDQVSNDAWTLAKKNKDYTSFTRARISDLPGTIKRAYTFSTYTLPQIFCMFLLGMFCWRKRLFTEVGKYIHLWRKIFWWGLIVGLGGNLFVFTMRILAFEKIYMPNRYVLEYAETIANPALTFFYISLFVFALQQDKNKNNLLLNSLRATGRIPLTNYFIQYIIMTLLMMPYGFNLDGHLFSQQLVLIVIVVFSSQVLLSVFWTKWFDYGPMEWLWRSLTYLKLQRLRKVKQ